MYDFSCTVSNGLPVCAAAHETSAGSPGVRPPCGPALTISQDGLLPLCTWLPLAAGGFTPFDWLVPSDSLLIVGSIPDITVP